MGLENLTKTTWQDLREALSHVPVRARNQAWARVHNLCTDVVKGLNNLALPIDVDATLRYAVDCRRCHKPICIGEGYVFKEISSEYEHYDCHAKTDIEMESGGDKKEGTK